MSKDQAPSLSEPDDLKSFVATIQQLSTDPDSSISKLFTSAAPLVIARAPGRLDVMGGIADYSGSLVLQLPLAQATLVAMQRAEDDQIRVVSLSSEALGPRHFKLCLEDFQQLITAGYPAARKRFFDDASDAWAAYVIGVLFVLLRELPAELNCGLRILIQSDVPEGKGISSSAALEVAVAQAFLQVIGGELAGEQLARLCQLAENQIAGAPCGIMDQMTSALGRDNHLLALLCQPSQVQGFVPVPPAIRFWGIDSGVRHAVSGSDYTAVRVGAFMGYRMICQMAGCPVQGPDSEGRMIVTDAPGGGYLANLSVGEFAKYAGGLPQDMTGADFLAKFGGTTDTVTRVDPLHRYAVYQSTAHPVFEHERVRRFRELLVVELTDTTLQQLGKLMFAAHESYSACGLGTDATDQLVQFVRDAGPAAGLYGAKITGGGSGGTVAVLGRADAMSSVREIAELYSRQSGRTTRIFSGTSPGACEFGTREVELSV